MKKIVAFLFAVMAVVLLNTPLTGTAEAAKVAVVPIQVNEQEVERAGDFSSYYWDIIINKLEYPEFELLDEDVVAKAVPEEGLRSFDKTSLMEVASQTGADIVIAMRIDRVHEKFFNFRTESMIGMTVRGEYASYNGVTGKYYDKKIRYYDETEDAYLIRTDWQQRWFVSELRRYLGRTIAVK